MKHMIFRSFMVLFSAALLLSCSEEATNPPDTVTISGVVQTASTNETVADAKVTALRHENSEELGSSITDADGAFVIAGLPRVTMDIRVEAEGYTPVLLEAMDPQTSLQAMNSLSVKMNTVDSTCCDGVLTVTVKDHLGARMMGALVRIWKNGSKLHQTYTDSLGVAVFTDLCKGAYGVDVIKTGYTEREFMFEINANCDPVNKTVVVEQLACCDGVLTLVVRDSSNNPVPNAIVLVRKGSKVIEDPRTDANGRIVVDGLCEGHYNYRISREGYKVIEGEFDINQSCDPVTREVTLVTVPGVCCDGVLTVTVKDPQGQPIDGALVKLWKNGAVLKKVTTNASGVAVFSDLCKGEYGVDVIKEGWTDREFGFAINENCDPVSKTVVMEQLPCCEGVFTLIVRDGNGNPVQGAKVLIRKGSKVIEDPRTDANGKIIVDGLCAGHYNYRISKEGWKVVEGEFDINENCDPVTREVTLEQVNTTCCDGVLTLVVRDSLNNPVKGALVLIRKGEKIIADPRTDANGRIVVDGLCEGHYTYRISKDGYKVVEGEFDINENCDPVTREVTLNAENICCSGVLKVIAVDSSNTPIEGATVRVWKNGAVLETATTNSNGRAVFDGLCAGPYGVDVQKSGLKGREFEFVINVNCDPYTKTVELLP